MNSHKYKGLSAEEVEALKKKFGPNVLKEKTGPSAVGIFFRQFISPLIFVLLLAALLSAYFREFANFWLIIVVIFVNSLMGFYQEYSAQKTLLALKKMIRPMASVIRDSKRESVEASELVPGDICVLAAGDQIPADGKIIEATNLLINEAILTGEQDAVDKKPNEDAPLFMGTTVLSGIGIMKVKKTGEETEIGKISTRLSEIKEEPTPLEKKLTKFSKDLVIVILIVCAIILIFGLFRERNFWTMLELSIVLAVAAIPEGLPIAATVILSLGMKRILRKKGLAKTLLAVETLGSASVICTDKTGTITQGKMQVVKTALINNKHAFLSLILANQQKDTLEVSLWKFVEKHSTLHPKKILDSIEKIYEQPFDSTRKYSLSVIKQEDKELSYVLGAPEIVLDFCEINQEKKQEVIHEIEDWANLGLKIVGAAYKDKGNLKSKSDFKWLGLVGIEDPIRPEVKETVAKCLLAGIKIKIVTGDFRQTAVKAASLIGLPSNDENVMEADELERISDKDLQDKIENITVFSRISPQQKLKIVKALQSKGEVVAMTGDGVNDALALKKADIAVVVNDASDVAKEVSDLILLDSNFKTIYLACQEGRTILSNIKKVVGFILSNSFVTTVVIFVAILLNLPTPLTVLMILWINLISDGPIDIMLGFEQREDGAMELSPEAIKKEQILDRFVIQTSIIISLFIGLVTVAMFYLIYKQTNNLVLARTIAFATVATASLIYVFSFKNLQLSVFKQKKLFQNKYLVGAIIYGLVLVLMVVYIPFLNKIFETGPLKLFYWLPILASGIIAMILVEISKKTTANTKNGG